MIVVPGTVESATNYLDPNARFTWRLRFYRVAVGLGSIEVAGSWKEKPIVIESYVLPEHRQAGSTFSRHFWRQVALLSSRRKVTMLCSQRWCTPTHILNGSIGQKPEWPDRSTRA